MERSEIESIRYLDHRAPFQPFLLLAMGLLVTEAALNCTVLQNIP